MILSEDFKYQDAHAFFKNMDKLIKYVNSKQDKINVFYSTPSCYLHSVYLANQTYQLKTDDFFPYGSDEHSYWTGYFISRPALKYYERVGNNFLQVIKQLNALSQLGSSTENQVSYLKEAMGIMQHHDAVAGTEKEHVNSNYALKLFKGIEKSKPIVDKAYAKLLSKKQVPKQLYCDSLNISACEVTEGEVSVAVTLYNPIAHQVNKYISLPVSDNTSFEVLDPSGIQVKSVITPIPKFVQSIPGRKSNAKNQLTFKVTLPPLGIATYLLKKTNSVRKASKLMELNKSEKVFKVKANSSVVLFNTENGLLQGIQVNGKEIPMNLSFHFYKGMNGDNRGASHRASGAYVFRPDGQIPTYQGQNVKSLYTTNELFTEVHQQWTSWLSQVVRVYNDDDVVVFDWVVGPIPVNDTIGKEIILKYETNLTTNNEFYTDANGRQVLKRVINYRPTWDYIITEPVSGNYYPINSRIYIKDVKQNIQMTVLTDRSQGGGSLSNGSVELMVHRRLLHDDAFGVGEPLNEPGVDGKGLVIRGQHYLLTSSISGAAKLHRELSQQLFLQPLITFSNLSEFKSEKDYFDNVQTIYSGLNNTFPQNVHLLTLEPWKDDKYLLRLEHFYQKDEDSVLSKPVSVDLKNLFKQFTITDAVEMTLGGNEKLSEATRLQFKTSTNEIQQNNEKQPSVVDNLKVTLNPMEIKTFVITVSSQ